MENIQVALRIRPLNRKELQKRYENVWAIPKLGTVTLSSSHSRDYLASKKISCTARTAFYFDQCFSPEQNNLQVYHQSVKRIVLSSLNGINGTIFMYGQTGSGKTYTMMGFNKSRSQVNNTVTSLHERDVSPNNYRSCPPLRKHTIKKTYASETENYQSLDHTETGSYLITGVTENTGVLVMGLRDIFETIENDMDKTYFLRCSYVEIYNDQVFDLLKPAERLTETLSVAEDANKEFFIKGVTEESISSIEEVLDKLRKGEANRHYARTTMNHSSSRSHTIFRLTVQSVTNNYIREYRREKSRSSTNINNFELRRQFSDSCEGGTKMEGTIVTESLLNFVDLAGSEKVTHHQLLLEESGFINMDQGGIYGRESMLAVNKMRERVKEGQHINKSLFFLTQVISLKSEGKNNQYIPYRNSPLTKILRSSLGGNSRTLIILCITPACAQFEQTMSTLRFGMSAKKIENKVQANIVTRDDAAGLKLLISEYEKKLKDSEIARQEEHAKCYSMSRQVEELTLQKNCLTEKLNNFCKSKVVKMAESVSQDDLFSFYKQIKDKNIYLNKVGVVFSGLTMNKYEKLNNSCVTFREHSKRNLTRRQRDLHEREFEDEEEGNTKRISGEVKNEAEESMSKLYTKFLKAYKEQNEILKKKLEVYEKNTDTVCERNITNFRNYLQSSSSFETLKKQCKETSINCKQLNQLKADLELYTTLKGVSELDEEGLTRLEKSFWEKLDQIKMERARRIIMREMSVVKETTQSDLNTETTFNRNIFETQNGDEQGESMSFEEIEASICQNMSNESGLLEKIKKERELVKTILNTGIEDIDRELEATRKALVDNTEIFAVYNEVNESKIVGKKVPSIATKRIERGDRTERDVSLSSYRQKLSVRKGSGHQITGTIKSSQVLSCLPKLDLGSSMGGIIIEHDLPKLPDHYMPMISTKRIKKAKCDSPKAFEGEFGTLKSQRRGRSETREVDDYSFDNKELKMERKLALEERSLEKLNKDIAVDNRGKSANGKLKQNQSADSLKCQVQGKMVEDSKKKEIKCSASVNSAKQLSVEKASGNSAALLAKQYQSNPSSLTHLQNKLSKHLNSLEKYFIKPASSSRRSRSIRAEQNSIIHYETTTRTLNDNSLIMVNKSKVKDESVGRVKLEEEFEYREDSEGEQKMDTSIVSNQNIQRIMGHKRDSIVQKKMVQDENIENPYSHNVSNIEDPRTLMEIREPFPDRFGLNITNIDKEETMFTNSIFSLKELDAMAKEKDHELAMENNVLKQLENILQKAEHSVELGDCSDFPLDQSKKRRRRADRLKKSADKTANI